MIQGSKRSLLPGPAGGAAGLPLGGNARAPGTPQQFAGHVESQTERWSVIRTSGSTVD